MTPSRLSWLIAALFASAFALNAQAADTAAKTPAAKSSATAPAADHHKAMRAIWDKLSPEEREAMHDIIREEMHGQREEQRAARDEWREEMRKRWESMTPEQREEHRKAMRERAEKMPPEDRPGSMQHPRGLCMHQGGDCPQPDNCPHGKADGTPDAKTGDSKPAKP